MSYRCIGTQHSNGAGTMAKDKGHLELMQGCAISLRWPQAQQWGQSPWPRKKCHLDVMEGSVISQHWHPAQQWVAGTMAKDKCHLDLMERCVISLHWPQRRGGEGAGTMAKDKNATWV